MLEKSVTAKCIYIRGVGTVYLKRSKRAKNLNITVRPFQNIVVSVPGILSFAKAAEITRSKRIWLLKHLKKIKEIEAKYQTHATEKKAGTREHILKLETYKGEVVKVKIASGVIKITYPEHLDQNAPQVKDAINNGIIAAYRREAKAFLPQRVAQLAAIHGFKYNEIRIKNLKSRWGSCSAKNNINLNLQIMKLPDELIDHILLHELLHTKVKNHSPQFWQMLEGISKNTKELRKKVKEYGMNIFY
ncbi:M48 family metallopeptidase [Candidatus Riflebacteria bacterium]